MADLLDRARCHLGRHNPLRCAGREDHTWTWDSTCNRWTATLSGRPATTGPAHRPPR